MQPLSESVVDFFYAVDIFKQNVSFYKLPVWKNKPLLNSPIWENLPFHILPKEMFSLV